MLGVRPEVLNLLSWGALLTGVGWGRGAQLSACTPDSKVGSP